MRPFPLFIHAFVYLKTHHWYTPGNKNSLAWPEGPLCGVDGNEEVHNDWTMYSGICNYGVFSPTCSSYINSPYKGSENFLEDRVERLQELEEGKKSRRSSWSHSSCGHLHRIKSTAPGTISAGSTNCSPWAINKPHTHTRRYTYTHRYTTNLSNLIHSTI